MFYILRSRFTAGKRAHEIARRLRLKTDLQITQFAKNVQVLARFDQERLQNQRKAKHEMLEACHLSPDPTGQILELYRLHNNSGFDQELIKNTLDLLSKAVQTTPFNKTYRTSPYFQSLINDIKHGMQSSVLLEPLAFSSIVESLIRLQYVQLELVQAMFNKGLMMCQQTLQMQFQVKQQPNLKNRFKKGFKKTNLFHPTQQWKDRISLLKLKDIAVPESPTFSDSEIDETIKSIQELVHNYSFDINKLLESIIKIRQDYIKIVNSQTLQNTINPNLNKPMLQIQQQLLNLGLISIEQVKNPALVQNPQRAVQIAQKIVGPIEVQHYQSDKLQDSKQESIIASLYYVAKLAGLPVQEVRGRSIEQKDIFKHHIGHDRSQNKVFKKIKEIYNKNFEQLKSIEPMLNVQNLIHLASLHCQMGEGRLAELIYQSIKDSSFNQMQLLTAQRLGFPNKKTNPSLINYWKNHLKSLSNQGLTALLNLFDHENQKQGRQNLYQQLKSRQLKGLLGYQYIQKQINKRKTISRPLVWRTGRLGFQAKNILIVPSLFLGSGDWMDSRFKFLKNRIQKITNQKIEFINITQIDKIVVKDPSTLQGERLQLLASRIEKFNQDTQQQKLNVKGLSKTFNNLTKLLIRITKQDSGALKQALKLKFNRILDDFTKRAALLELQPTQRTQLKQLISSIKFPAESSQPKYPRTQIQNSQTSFMLIDKKHYQDKVVCRDPAIRSSFSCSTLPSQSFFQTFRQKHQQYNYLYAMPVLAHLQSKKDFKTTYKKLIKDPKILAQHNLVFPKLSPHVQELSKFRIALRELQPQELIDFIHKFQIQHSNNSEGIILNRNWEGAQNEVHLEAAQKQTSDGFLLKRMKTRQNVSRLSQYRRAKSRQFFDKFQKGIITGKQYQQETRKVDQQTKKELLDLKGETIQGDLLTTNNKSRIFVDSQTDLQSFDSIVQKYSLVSKEFNPNYLKGDTAKRFITHAYRKIQALKSFLDQKDNQVTTLAKQQQKSLLQLKETAQVDYFFPKVNSLPRQTRKMLQKLGVNVQSMKQLTSGQLVAQLGLLVSDSFYESFIQGTLTNKIQIQKLTANSSINFETAFRQAVYFNDRQIQILKKLLLIMKPKYYSKLPQGLSEQRLKQVQRKQGKQGLASHINKQLFNWSQNLNPEQFKDQQTQRVAQLACQLLNIPKVQSLNKLDQKSKSNLVKLLVNSGHFLDSKGNSFRLKLYSQLTQMTSGLEKALLRGMVARPN